MAEQLTVKEQEEKAVKAAQEEGIKKYQETYNTIYWIILITLIVIDALFLMYHLYTSIRKGK